jgi:LemA protein
LTPKRTAATLPAPRAPKPAACDWGDDATMEAGSWLGLMLLAVLVIGAVVLYNRLVAERNQVRQGYADIDVQLKRRADLVPRLVDTVRAYADYEKALLTSVTELRANALGAQRAAERFGIERALGERLQQLVLLQEAYPQLKADANFRQLSEALVEVEDHLQYARRFYNGAVKQYLTRIESFPDLVVARLLGFRPEPFFETEDRAAVRVTL